MGRNRTHWKGDQFVTRSIKSVMDRSSYVWSIHNCFVRVFKFIITKSIGYSLEKANMIVASECGYVYGTYAIGVTLCHAFAIFAGSFDKWICYKLCILKLNVYKNMELVCTLFLECSTWCIWRQYINKTAVRGDRVRS